MEDQAAGAAVGVVVLLVQLGLVVLGIAATWVLFDRAGKPGWASIVPIWNLVVLAQVAGKPGWWAVLMLVPVVNFVIWIMLSIALAERFGKGLGFGLGLAFLGVIFLPLLAFSGASYQPPRAALPA